MTPDNDRQTSNHQGNVIARLNEFGVDWARLDTALQFVRDQKGSYSGCLLQMQGSDIVIPQQLLRAADISPGVTVGSTPK